MDHNKKHPVILCVMKDLEIKWTCKLICKLNCLESSKEITYYNLALDF